jgi:hypothetical protein
MRIPVTLGDGHYLTQTDPPMGLTSTLIIPGLAAAPGPVAESIRPGLSGLCRHSRAEPDALMTSQHLAVWRALGGGDQVPGAAVASWFALHGEPPDDPLPDQASKVPVTDAGPEQQPSLWIRLSQAALEYGGRLIAGPEGLIWLKLADDPGVGGADPFRAAGQPVDLPTDGNLLKLLNHMQMVLHTEQDAGFNSLWFWGGGPLPEAMPDASAFTVVAGDAVARGIALACGAQVEDRWRGQQPFVTVDARLSEAADADEWQRVLGEMDEIWFAPLQGSAAGVRIVDNDGAIETETVTSWWRRLLMRSGSPESLFGWPIE